MNSQSIFDYSDEFLKEIIEDIIKLKIQNYQILKVMNLVIV